MHAGDNRNVYRQLDSRHCAWLQNRRNRNRYRNDYRQPCRLFIPRAVFIFQKLSTAFHKILEGQRILAGNFLQLVSLNGYALPFAVADNFRAVRDNSIRRAGISRRNGCYKYADAFNRDIHGHC